MLLIFDVQAAIIDPNRYSVLSQALFSIDIKTLNTNAAVPVYCAWKLQVLKCVSAGCKST
jgi:hypothetical protein